MSTLIDFDDFDLSPSTNFNITANFFQDWQQSKLYRNEATTNLCSDTVSIFSSSTPINSCVGPTPCSGGKDVADLSIMNEDGYLDLSGICAAKEVDGNGTPGCPEGWWEYCDYDWPGSIASASLCTLPDPLNQCPDFLKGDNTLIKANGSDKEIITTFTNTVDGTPNMNNNDNSSCPTLVNSPVGLRCNYNPNNFDFTALNNWLSFNWTDTYKDNADSNFNKILVPNFCSRTADSDPNNNLTQYCPVDPFFTGKKMPNCSYMTLLNDPNNIGETCRSWCTSNPELCDQTQGIYVGGVGVDNLDAACYNRSNYDEYTDYIEAGLIEPAQCWWLPCTGTNNLPYMIPLALSEQPGCPDLCVNIINANNNINTNNNINNSQTGNSVVLDCTGSDGSDGSDGSNGSDGSDGSNDKSKRKFTLLPTNKNNKHLIAIFVILILFVFLPLIIFVVIIFKSRKN